MNRSDDSNHSLQKMQQQAERLQRQRRQPRYSPLLGFGTFGVIGWSVALPMVAGAFLGGWLNRVAPQKFSWTIALILAGATLGGLLAARWLARQQAAAGLVEQQADQLTEPQIGQPSADPAERGDGHE